jgi:hypothetical protein
MKENEMVCIRLVKALDFIIPSVFYANLSDNPICEFY